MAAAAVVVGVLVQFDFCCLQDGYEWPLMGLQSARKPETTL